MKRARGRAPCFVTQVVECVGLTNANCKVALGSYGSISYAGLLSYIYSDLKQSDPRVQAVMGWLRKNFSLEVNPGMGPQGYFYNLHLMTKALTAAKVDDMETNSGQKIDWRRKVAMRLIKLQKAEGSWQSANGRRWEKDPNPVTAYAVNRSGCCRKQESSST